MPTADLPAPGFVGPFWRVFPWDSIALPGAPYSVAFVPPVGSQTVGRFGVRGVPVLYLAETPEHALAEVLRRFTGKPLLEEHLLRADRNQPGVYHPLALARVELPSGVIARVPDLDDTRVAARLGVYSAGSLAAKDRETTQAIARRVHSDPANYGFRWWSAIKGEWHSTMVFLDRVDIGVLRFGVPVRLHLGHPVVRAVASELDMDLAAPP